jgi:hypothetical protein
MKLINRVQGWFIASGLIMCVGVAMVGYIAPLLEAPTDR